MSKFGTFVIYNMEQGPKIYFAASIRGGRDDVELYRELILYMQTLGKVLTEHIGLDSLKSSGILNYSL